MIRIRAYVLVVVSAAALLATAVPAMADEFHSEGAHTTWSGVQTAAEFSVYTFKAGTVKCKEISYAGTTSAATATTISLLPSFTECTAFGFLNSPVHANGCEYQFHTKKEGSSSQGLSIVCPEGKAIVVTALNCHVSIPSQSGMTGVSYSNTGSGGTRDIDVGWVITGLKYTQASKTFPGCTSGTFTDGTSFGGMRLKGADTEKGQVGVWVSAVHQAETDAHSTATGLATELHSEAAHTTWSGVQPVAEDDVFTFKAGTVKCVNISYTGTTSAATSTTLKLAPTFANCTAFGFVSSSIHSNGCEYQFHTQKEGTSTQAMDIICPEGKAIVVTAFNCHVSIPSQSGLTGVSYSNTGSGSSRDLDIAWTNRALKYTQASKSFPGCTNGTFTDGSYLGGMTLKGANTEGKQVGAWASKPLPTEEELVHQAETHAHQTKTQPKRELHSEVAHSIWQGVQSGESKFTFNSGTVGCGEGGYSGTSSAATVTTLNVVPSYLLCRFSGAPYIAIHVNECQFQLHTQKESSSQGVSIVCPAGKAIVITGSACQVTIPSQNALTQVTYENTGSGSTRDIDVGWSISGLAYVQHSKSAPGCTNGTFFNGTFSGEATFKAFNTAGEQVGVWGSLA